MRILWAGGGGLTLSAIPFKLESGDWRGIINGALIIRIIAVARVTDWFAIHFGSLHERGVCTIATVISNPLFALTRLDQKSTLSIRSISNQVSWVASTFHPLVSFTLIKVGSIVMSHFFKSIRSYRHYKNVEQQYHHYHWTHLLILCDPYISQAMQLL